MFLSHFKCRDIFVDQVTFIFYHNRRKMSSKNLKCFQQNISGHAGFVLLDDGNTSPDTPYSLSLEEQTDTTIYVQTPTNLDAFPDAKVCIPVYPKCIKTYYLRFPYGSGEDISRDVVLWQFWRRAFGFQKIPIGFAVFVQLGISRGTNLAITFSYEPPYEYILLRVNDWNYIPYPLYITSTGLEDPVVIGRTFYTNTVGIVYSEENDQAFQSNYPELYNECVESCKK